MKTERPRSVGLGDVQLDLPVFFPSVSSVKTGLSPIDYVRVLYSLRNISRQFLVSAFDITHGGNALQPVLQSAIDEGVTVLMDSGNYESYWKEKRNDWHQPMFQNGLRAYPFSFAFSFDEQNPSDKLDENLNLLVNSWRLDQRATNGHVVVPIVHGNRESMALLCRRVAEETGAIMVAVAERRLGQGLFDRIRAILAIRKELNSTDRYVALHLLGTGNPTSIAVYTWAGADSYDGLEWCQTSVDCNSGLLHHLTHYDIFSHQTDWGHQDVSFSARALAHNLTFYSDWMRRLSDAAHAGDVLDFCKHNLQSSVFKTCADTFDWESNQ